MQLYELKHRLSHAWNTFKNKDPTGYMEIGPGFSGYRPDRYRSARGYERSIVTSINNRIAMDVASMNIRHVQLDKNGRFLKEMDTGLNNCLKLEANIDQNGRNFIQDVVLSMLDEGVVAIVPVDTEIDPQKSAGIDVLTMRTGKILDWYPKHVRVELYNENSGRHEEVILPKTSVAIVENPLYAIINEPNSTMQRLIRKLSLLDIVDEKTSSGKLDLIIQLPYVVKTPQRRQQAEIRRKDIENQLAEGKYGIAYTDGTEKITQLNRPVENNLMKQIEYLTNMVYSQIGMTQSILDGTADEKTMLNYYNRTVEPILAAIVDELKRKFLSKNARSRMQTVTFFRDPFKLVPVNDIAEIADKFTRNEIMTANEIRQVIGMKPSDDPHADELRNKNLSAPAGSEQPSNPVGSMTDNQEEETNQNGKTA